MKVKYLFKNNISNKSMNNNKKYKIIVHLKKILMILITII